MINIGTYVYIVQEADESGSDGISAICMHVEETVQHLIKDTIKLNVNEVKL